MENYIIIHGSFGSKDGNWFPWLKEQLENNHKKVEVPQMPVGVGNQNFENWSNVLKQLVINENTIIIAHSIAPIFVCKYLISNKIRVKKLVFVCGFNNYLGIDSDFDSVNEPMFVDNYEEIKNYCKDIVCFYSDNDPYVKIEVEKEFADIVSNEQHIIKNGGHINAESGYTEFADILQVLNIQSVRYAVRVFAFKDNKIACIKYKNINKDYFDIPGGKIENGETEIQTCIRKFKEETGMDIDDLKCIGNIQIIYPDNNKKFIMKTYIANKVNGEPQEFEDNYSYWIPIKDLTENEKRFAITHLLDDDMIKYLKSNNINIIFTCDSNHNVIDMKII